MFPADKSRDCVLQEHFEKPENFILDDSTSAVDTATEAKIRQSFTTSLKHSTKIIIAQRITSVIDADKIIVLEDGKIVGMGNHNELMKNCEEYRDIYYSQTDKEKKSLIFVTSYQPTIRNVLTMWAERLWK